jgi:hypothetical protein
VHLAFNGNVVNNSIAAWCLGVFENFKKTLDYFIFFIFHIVCLIIIIIIMIFDRKILSTRNVRNVAKISRFERTIAKILIPYIHEDIDIARCSKENWLNVSKYPLVGNGKNVSIDMLDDEKEENYGVVTSLFALHNVNDIDQKLAKIKQIMNNDGVFCGMVYSLQNLQELSTAYINAQTTLGNSIFPSVHPVMDIKTCGMLLKAAGFSNVSCANLCFKVKYWCLMDLLVDLKMCNEMSVLKNQKKGLTTQKFMQTLSDEYEKVSPDFSATFDIVYFVCRP